MAPPSKHTDEARRILAEGPLIDGHNDWPWNMREWYGKELERSDLDLYAIPIGQTDLNRLRAGLVGGQFWSAYVPCHSPDEPRQATSDEVGLSVLRKTLQQIDLIHRLVDTYPMHFGLATTASEVWGVFRSGRIACMIGVEGLHQIGNSFSVLRMYRDLGVRYITLTHDCNNLYADSATSPGPTHNGLSEQGRLVLQEMNRAGLMIDLSHTSQLVQEQALSISTAPVIFSHSSCYSLTSHPRNVSDKVLDMLKPNGGVIMICFFDSHVKPHDGSPVTLSDVVDHIMHVGKRIGYAHVGIGSDFDGMLRGPQGLDEVSDYPSLVEMLLDRGLSEHEVKQVIGLNVLRVMEETESVSARLRRDRSMRAIFDPIESGWTDEIREMLVKEGNRRRAKKANSDS